jgi:hypothetical protein
VGYFILQPEAAGRPTSPQGSGTRPSCVFDTWLGDDVVSAHPLLLVTTHLKEALEGLPEATGFSLAPVEATPSPFFEGHNPGRALATFWSVNVHGRAGVDDLGRAPDGSVVASMRVVDTMGRFALRHGTLRQYTGSKQPEPQVAGAATR